MNRLKVGIGTVALALLAGMGAVQACEGQNPIFQDNFATLDPTWGDPTDEIGVADNKMVLKPEANFALWVPSNAGLYDDIDLCAEFTAVAAVDASHSYAGLIFWYADDDNFYAFEYDADGNATVSRRTRGRWLKQVVWKTFSAVKANDGSVNELRVVTVGNKATFYVNGTQFAELKGQAPENGQQVGMIAASPEKAVATYSIANFTINEPKEEPQQNPNQPPPLPAPGSTTTKP
jgi:hypothetical protein